MKEYYSLNGKLKETIGEYGTGMDFGSNYGLNVFDGLLCIKTSSNSASIFRLKDHVKRLRISAEAAGLRLAFPEERISSFITEVVKANGCGSYYIRPLVRADGPFFPFNTEPKDASLAIFCRKFSFLAHSLAMKRKRVKLAVWQTMRLSWPREIAQAKISGKYLLSFLALRDARRQRADDVVLLDEKKHVSEASTSNIFYSRKGMIVTPRAETALAGITRSTVMRIAERLHIPVREESFEEASLLNADEVFLTGTARGITSVRAIGKKRFGRAIIADAIRNEYIAILKKNRTTEDGWLTTVSFNDKNP